MSEPLNLLDVADFTWDFGHQFLLEVEGKGLFVWSDPDYNGDNTIRPFKGNPRNFTSPGFAGRCKGKHQIQTYCGSDVKFELEDTKGP